MRKNSSSLYIRQSGIYLPKCPFLVFEFFGDSFRQAP